jgi:hypothetical protein
MTLFLGIVGLIVIIWWFKRSRNEREPAKPVPILNKTCLKCGQLACEIRGPHDDYRYETPVRHYDIDCTACGYRNLVGVPGLSSVIELCSVARYFQRICYDNYDGGFREDLGSELSG